MIQFELNRKPKHLVYNGLKMSKILKEVHGLSFFSKKLKILVWFTSIKLTKTKSVLEIFF